MILILLVKTIENLHKKKFNLVSSKINISMLAFYVVISSYRIKRLLRTNLEIIAWMAYETTLPLF